MSEMKLTTLTCEDGNAIGAWRRAETEDHFRLLGQMTTVTATLNRWTRWMGFEMETELGWLR